MDKLVGEMWTPPTFVYAWELFDGTAYYSKKGEYVCHVAQDQQGVWRLHEKGFSTSAVVGQASLLHVRLVVEELERRANMRALPSAQSEVDALFPVSKADDALLAHVQTLNQRLSRVKVALWSAGALGLVELVHLLHH